MTKEELKALYPGDVLKISVPGWIEIPEAVVLRFEDYDKDGLPDKVYVIGKRTGGGDTPILAKPEWCTFIRHDIRIEALLNAGGDVDYNLINENESLNKEVTRLLNKVNSLVEVIEHIKIVNLAGAIEHIDDIFDEAIDEVVE